MVQTGKVKWYNDLRGFGFIRSDGIPEDIFVHHTAIHMEGYRALFPDQDVEFELKSSKRGLTAVKVRVIDVPKKGTVASA
jgi:CspA family cold shock protein